MRNSSEAIEIIKGIKFWKKLQLLGKLMWISDKDPPKNLPNAYFFCIDNVYK